MHKHICKNCKALFEGRKNRLYCNPKCKTAFNNAKSEVKNRYYNETVSEIKRNRKIVEMIYLIFGSAILPKSILHDTELNFGCITGYTENGNTVFGEYVIQHPRQSQFSIKKIT